MKRANESINRRKLMDKLGSPPHFGPLLGLLATTFEMQPEFFETDFLPAVLNLGAWDDRSWTSRIEMERKLSLTESATVLMDASRYRNRPRSLRVKILPLSLPGGRAQHSKVVLLVYENAVRLIVGSANLTEPGYRENREAAAVLTATEEKREEGALIQSALSGLPQVLGPWLSRECTELTNKALAMLDAWASPLGEQREWFIWGGASEAFWKSFISHWPDRDRIQRITVVSPFWSEDEKQRALVEFLRALAEKGCLDREPEVRLLTEATPDTQTTYKPTMPPTYGAFDFRNLEARVYAEAVDPAVLREEVDLEGFNKHRSLHAKIVLLEGEEASLACIGSANFTRRGWGFLEAPSRANVEAGIVFLRKGKTRVLLDELVPKTTGPKIELIGDAAEALARPEPTPEMIPWPYFLEEVSLAPAVRNPDRLDLVVSVHPEHIKGEWSVNLPAREQDREERVLLSSHEQDGAPPYRTDLSEDSLNALLGEQEVLVCWWDSDEARPFPLNVVLEARYNLPVSPASQTFSEEHLILYYQGRITWEELFPDPDGPTRRDDGDTWPPFDNGGVDTSHIQSYQIREFVEALKGIMDDLKGACKGTEPAMRLALLGPVSPVTLARVIVDAVNSERRSPVAAAFQLVEIWACLQVASKYETNGKYRKSWLEYVGKAMETVDRHLGTIREGYPDYFTAQSAFTRYEKSVRKYYGRASRT